VLARAGREWLADALDDLASEVDELRQRVRRVTAAHDKRLHLRAARAARPKSAAPKAGAALKARAIAR